MKKLSVLMLVLLVAAAACKGPSNEDTGSEASTPSGAAPLGSVNDLNIGDAEQMIDLLVDLAGDSKGPGISASPLTDPLGRTTMLTLDVKAPHPKELWLNYTIRARRTFPDTPVILRFKILAEGREIDSFSSVVSKTRTPSLEERKVNALAGMSTIPATMLVKPTVEVLMMPEGTSAEGLDPETAETKPERMSKTLASMPPVRINFQGAGAVAAPAAEAKPEGAAQ